MCLVSCLCMLCHACLLCHVICVMFIYHVTCAVCILCHVTGYTLPLVVWRVHAVVLYRFLWCSMCVECIHVCVSFCSVCFKYKQLLELVYCHSAKHKVNSWHGLHESWLHLFICASSQCRCTTVQLTQVWVSPKPTYWSGIWNQATWWWPSHTCLLHLWPRSAQTSSSNGWGGVFILLLFIVFMHFPREWERLGKQLFFCAEFWFGISRTTWEFLAVNHLNSFSQSDHK